MCVCVTYLYIFNFENYNICNRLAALRRYKFSNSNMRALERERESKRARERERDEKGKRGKVCKCNSLPASQPAISHPPTKVNFRELLI
jgi:hypothetical protein